GLGRIGKGLSHRSLPRNPRPGSKKPGARSRRFSSRARIDSRRHRQLGAAYRRAEDSGGNRRGARPEEWGTRRFLAMLAQDRELVVGVCAGRARRSHEESPPRTWHARLAGRNGAGVLLGIRFAEMVRGSLIKLKVRKLSIRDLW